MDTAKVVGVSSAVLGVVTLSSLKDGLSCLLTAVTIGYVIWKWRRAIRNDKRRHG